MLLPQQPGIDWSGGRNWLGKGLVTEVIQVSVAHSGKIPAWIRLESSGNDCSMGASSR